MKTTLYFLSILLAPLFSINAQNMFPASGNVGIGTTSPDSKLTVKEKTKTQQEQVEAQTTINKTLEARLQKIEQLLKQ